MRIALFHNLPSGGAKRATYEWMRRLATGHEIHVFTLGSADHAFCDTRPYARTYRIYDFAPRKLFGTPWGRLNQVQRWLDLGSLTGIGREMAHDIDAGCFDVVFANSCLYSSIPVFLQYLRTPAVYYLHEPFGSSFAREFRRPYLEVNKCRELLNQHDPLIGLYRHRLEEIQTRSVGRTTRLLANSHFTRAQMKQAFGVDAPVCHSGVDCDSFRPMPAIGKENHVISVGELSPRKGFDFLLESLGQIPSDKRPPLTLVCNRVDSAERGYVEFLATKHEVGLKVLTNLDTAQLAMEYNKARVCVCASVLEPFGLVPLEAMSCGLPVVAVREGGLEESVKHQRTGLLVERHPAKFAAAVQHLLSSPDLAAEHGSNGREEALLHWTWDKSAAELQDHLIDCARVSKSRIVKENAKRVYESC